MFHAFRLWPCKNSSPKRITTSLQTCCLLWFVEGSSTFVRLGRSYRVDYNDLYVGKVHVSEDTSHGSSSLWSTMASSFPRRLYLPSVSTRCICWWVDGERVPNPLLEVYLEARIFGTAGKSSNRYATRPPTMAIIFFTRHVILSFAFFTNK